MGAKLSDKRYWLYHWLVFKTAWSLFSKHFEGWRKFTEPFVIGLLSIVALSIIGGKSMLTDWQAVTASIFGGPILYSLIILLINLIIAPFHIYKNHIARTNAEYIEINPFYHPKKDVRKTEICVRNEKDIAIDNCRCSLASFQIDRTIPDYLDLPRDLPWVIESKLVEENITIPAGSACFVAVEAWDRLVSGRIIHVPSQNKNGEDYAPSVGIEFCGKFGLGVYRDRYYKVGFCFTGTIDGIEIKTLEYFELNYDGRSLKLKRVKK